jgi:uncharacterized membrane protein YeiB
MSSRTEAAIGNGGQVGPVGPRDRAAAPDLARGLALLGIALYQPPDIRTVLGLD